MLFCDKHFRKEFVKIESWAKWIGIPLFTLFSVLYISPYPLSMEKGHILFHISFSFAGVFAIWFSVRFIVMWFRKKCCRMHFALRLSVQLFITSLIAVFIIYILDVIGTYYFVNDLDLCYEFEDFSQKGLYLTAILFTFLINTLYVSFYLFLKLSENVIETETIKKEIAEAQYQNLTSRLNPHFLFNSLNTLTTVVEEDPKKAVEYIRELSVVYRYVLSGQKLTWADVRAEIKFTQSYILLLKMRFEQNLSISLDICEEYQNYHILPLTIQLLIENAVKHNEISNSRPLNIKVFCKDELLIVTNNKQLRKIMPATTRVGLHNISERYRFLVNREVIVEDKAETFTVSVPLIKNIENDREHIEEYM